MFKEEERELHQHYERSIAYHEQLGFYPPARRSVGESVRKHPFRAVPVYILSTLWLLPRNIGVLLMRLYRNTVSRLYGDVCRFYPTCSAYALQSIHKRGLILGSILGSWRIVRCNPWAEGGLDKPSEVRHGRYCSSQRGFVFLNPDIVFVQSDMTGEISSKNKESRKLSSS